MMRLSEAIRLGAMLHPQHFVNMHKYRDDGSGNDVIVASCALGAAEDAGYLDVFESQLSGVEVSCPDACGLTHYLANVIAHLNDDHRWTREAIADWVASQEPIDQPDTVAVGASIELGDPGGSPPR